MQFVSFAALAMAGGALGFFIGLSRRVTALELKIAELQDK